MTVNVDICFWNRNKAVPPPFSTPMSTATAVKVTSPWILNFPNADEADDSEKFKQKIVCLCTKKYRH